MGWMAQCYRLLYGYRTATVFRIDGSFPHNAHGWGKHMLVVVGAIE